MPTLTLAHSADPDDVFMWWPLGSPTATPAFDTGGFRFEPIEEDIQVLNRRAIERGDLDITAISINAYPLVKDRYRLTDCAGSFGEGYGPKIVVRESSDAPCDALAARDWLRGPRVIAVPGIDTTAFLTLRLMLDRSFRHVELPFHRIADAVASGDADAGLLIHDAQLTYARLGLREIGDVGAWWCGATGLPLPLGGNVVRRDLDQRFGVGATEHVASLLGRSIRWALDHHDEGIARIAHRYPDLDRATLDRYLSMYVSPLTVACGEAGAEAIRRLLMHGFRAGVCPDPGEIDLLSCGGEGAGSGRNPAARGD